MKFAKKRELILLLLAVLALPLSAQNPNTSISKFAEKIDTVTKDLGKAMITNSGLGLNWSDAHIGQLLALPPHFGIGASMGFTAIPMDKFDSLYKEFDPNGLDIPNLPLDILPLPTVAGEIRIGGFFFPFDIGVKALPLPAIDVGDLKLKYTMVGGDLRYALMQDRGLKPAISIGVGVTYTDLSISTSVGNPTNLDLTEMAAINPAYGSAALNITAPKLDFAMKNTTLDLKVQISKKLFIITPYLGLGLSYGWSTVDFGANSTITITPSSGVPTSWKDDIMGFTGLSLENTGLGKSTTYSGLGIRGFGGFSLNIFVLKIDITGLYDILNGYWGAGVGLRVQI